MILRNFGNNHVKLIEVKSSTKKKEAHDPDIAIQWHVLERSGLTVDQASLVVIDKTYVHAGGLEGPWPAETILKEIKKKYSICISKPGCLTESENNYKIDFI